MLDCGFMTDIFTKCFTYFTCCTKWSESKMIISDNQAAAKPTVVNNIATEEQNTKIIIESPINEKAALKNHDILAKSRDLSVISKRSLSEFMKEGYINNSPTSPHAPVPPSGEIIVNTML